MRLFKRKRQRYDSVAPDEIFLDARNIPEFDTQQFEGRIETPITKRTIAFFAAACLLIGLIFLGKVGMLQLVYGSEFSLKSEHNSLNRQPLFADRGVIFDRFQTPLAWNSENNEDEFPLRLYIEQPGFSHVLGYVAYPKRDSKGFYWQDYFEGRAGIEKYYNSTLQGKNGSKIIERNARGEVQTEHLVDQPVGGENITLTIDAELQAVLYQAIADLASSGGYSGGAGAIMDTESGELLALTNFPEYDSATISKGEAAETINAYFTDNRHPLLNRVTTGLYTPGSTVKPFLALGVLNEKLIDPDKRLESNGFISIPNPYNPDQPTIFKDWKVHGPVDMRRALAVSSNTYFFTIGGGYQGQEGLGIDRINKYINQFEIGTPTGLPHFPEADGVVPNPTWKERVFGESIWRIGDTYNTAIGQYGFQITPLQLLRGIAAIANRGTLYTPHLVAEETVPLSIELPFSDADFEVIHEGMRQAVTEGTAAALSGTGVTVAAKTGTAQIGVENDRVNSWTVGFFPYERPRYAFVVLMERGPTNDTIGASRAMREVLLWINGNRQEYIR